MNKEENIFTQINDLEKYDKPLINIYEKLIAPVMNEEVQGVPNFKWEQTMCQESNALARCDYDTYESLKAPAKEPPTVTTQSHTPILIMTVFLIHSMKQLIYWVKKLTVIILAYLITQPATEVMKGMTATWAGTPITISQETGGILYIILRQISHFFDT